MFHESEIIDLAAARERRAAEQAAKQEHVESAGAADPRAAGVLTGLHRPQPTLEQVAARLTPRITRKAPQLLPEDARRIATMSNQEIDAEQNAVLKKISRLHNIGFIVVPQYLPVYYGPLDPMISAVEEAVGRIARDAGGDETLRKRIGLIGVYLHQDRLHWQVEGHKMDYELFVSDDTSADQIEVVLRENLGDAFGRWKNGVN